MCGIGLTLFPTTSLAINDHSSTANFCNNCNIQHVDTDHSNNTSNDHDDNHPTKNNNNHNQGQIQQGSFCSCHDMNCRLCKDQILHQSLSSRGPDYQSSLWFRQERSLSLSSSSSSSCCSSSCSSSWDMNLYASVLHMRGKELVRQPYSIQNDDGDRRCYFLCWNGECYSHDAMYGQPWMDVGCSSSSSVGEKSIEKMTKDENSLENGEDCKKDYRNQMSDTVIVMNLIQQALEEEEDRERGSGDLFGSHHERLCTIMGRIHGEYSFLLYCPSTSNSSNRDCDGTPAAAPPPPTTTGGVIYFGRDPLGRRSLVMGTTNTKEDHTSEDSSKGKSILNSLILSSVVPQLGGGVHHGNTDKGVIMMGMGNDDMLFEELPAGRVYRLDVFSGELTFLPIVVSQQTFPSQQMSSIGKPQIPLSPTWVVEDEDIPYPILKAAEGMYQHLNHAVRRRVMDAPIIVNTKEAIHQNQKQASSVAVLFSGGVDSVVLAALCHDHVPLDQPIDLINVAFASSECHGAKKVVDPFSLSPDRQAALLSYQEMKCQWPNRHWRFIAVNVDYETVLEMEDTICKLISPLTSTMDFNIGTAMWFASRGLGQIVDCDNGENNLWKTHMLKESKHLRFCQKSSSASNKNGKSSDIFGPCMTRGCKRLAERGRCRFGVCKVCCSSIFQRRINQYLGGRSNFCHYHSEMAKSLKSNKKTSVQENVLKNSKVKQKKNKTEAPSSDQVSHAQKEEKLLYQSCAKVVIVGIGADEQIAGYGRHRAIYNKGGYEALRQELAMEKSRLWTRNLGRDDRCISNHGKEARFPFLDDDVTAYLNSLDITEMVDMTKPQGMGDKMILRLVAKRLGVTQCSGLVKRAIQFGSRIAKCSEVDRFGSSRNASGSAKHIRSKNPVD